MESGELTRTLAGSADPRLTLALTTPVAKTATPDVFSARNRHIAFVAVPLSPLTRSSCRMASMPNGVAALPSPSTFAAMLRLIMPIAG